MKIITDLNVNLLHRPTITVTKAIRNMEHYGMSENYDLNIYTRVKRKKQQDVFCFIFNITKISLLGITENENRFQFVVQVANV